MAQNVAGNVSSFPRSDEESVKEYQIIEGTNVSQLSVRMSQLGASGWKVVTMRALALPRQVESSSGSSPAMLYVLMELDVPAPQ
jgi:hypothetical protein